MNEERLKESGLKKTDGRKLVLQVMSDNQGPMTAEEIFLAISQIKNLDYSTVYRILSVFTSNHITCKSIGSNGVAYYQLEDHNHSHYIVCSGCHKKVIIEDCPLEAISNRLKEQTGFQITGHNLEFVGECPECQKQINK